jgi:hypothetical protein
VITLVVANEKVIARQVIPSGTCPVSIWIPSRVEVSLECVTFRGDSPRHH